jgi:hypothetical protein
MIHALVPCCVAEPSLLTDPPTKIYSPPVGIPIDTTFPYQCAPGVLGSAEERHQLSALCQSPCPAGYYCPTAATVQAVPCSAGHFCPSGSSSEIPCPVGTFSSAMNLSSSASCLTCPEGTSCPNIVPHRVDSANAVRSRQLRQRHQPIRVHAVRCRDLCQRKRRHPVQGVLARKLVHSVRSSSMR